MNKKLQKFVLVFLGAFAFGFMDTDVRNKSGALWVMLERSLFSTVLLSGGFIGAQLSDGETFKKAFLNCNPFALVFFVGYFLGALISLAVY